MKVICENFRVNVQEVLNERGWTRSKLAAILGVTPGYVSQVLNGLNEPGLAVVGRFADALDVPAGRLVEKTTPMPTKRG